MKGSLVMSSSTLKRKIATVAISGMGFLGAGAALATSASAEEYALSLDSAGVQDAYNSMQVATDSCVIGTVFYPVPVGLTCGAGMDEYRDALSSAYYHGCGLDSYYTPGDYSFDGSYRYVVCP